MPSNELPEYRDWSIPAVRLLQGAVYADDERAWGPLLSSQAQLSAYFARIGLRLVVDEAEGLAYLRQLADDELTTGYDRVPKLFRKTRLGYDETLLCVLLREELRRFEEDDLEGGPCVAETAALFERWKDVAPSRRDEVRARRDLTAALGKLEDLGFVRHAATEPESWEVRRILKARLPAAELERLRANLLAAAGRSTEGDPMSESDG